MYDHDWLSSDDDLGGFIFDDSISDGWTIALVQNKNAGSAYRLTFHVAGSSNQGARRRA